jgi:hypothetical protein
MVRKGWTEEGASLCQQAIWFNVVDKSFTSRSSTTFCPHHQDQTLRETSPRSPHPKKTKGIPIWCRTMISYTEAIVMTRPLVMMSKFLDWLWSLDILKYLNSILTRYLLGTHRRRADLCPFCPHHGATGTRLFVKHPHGQDPPSKKFSKGILLFPNPNVVLWLHSSTMVHMTRPLVMISMLAHILIL